MNRLGRGLVMDNYMDIWSVISLTIRIVKCKKKIIREPPNVTKELSHVMLKLYNVRMEPSNVRKK